jgi:aryl-alcohol dehydrogenase-like predicted oxidoreductase
MNGSIEDLTFSRLVVGTVQFGLPYGIANRAGQPGFDEACDIVRYAIEHGATTLDTAATYGQSEEVLGRVLQATGLKDMATVVTKIRHVKTMPGQRTATAVQAWIRDSVHTSLRHLRLGQLPLVLFHDSADIEYMETLLRLKEEGLVRHAGVSVIAPDQMPQVLCTPGVEAIQIAASMLDQRILGAGDLGRAAEAGLAVFVRSIYLQGLLLMPEEEIVPALSEAIPARRSLERLAAEAGLSMAEMALRYGLSLPGVTAVLVGVETTVQMKENVRIAAAGGLPPDLVREIREVVPALPDRILFPGNWPGPMK